MKVVLTGSSGGIGSVIKKSLADNKIEVIELKSSSTDLSKSFKVDIENADGLIHCAGINVLQSLDKIVKEEFDKVFNINTFSFISLCQQIKFNKGSNIIAVGSLYSFLTRENRLQYIMSKHALLGAVKTLALELSPLRIKVNMVSPGFVDTPMTRKNNSKERIEELNSFIPLGLTPPQEIANLCLFLISSNNSITGQNIVVDGGYSCIPK